MKRKVAIVTDSTSDLSKEIIDKFNIHVLSLHINFGEETYQDGREIDALKLYNLVDIKKQLPTTSAVTIYEFSEYFDKLIKLDYDVIFIGISSKLSSTFSNAVIAKREFEEDRIIAYDSKNLSTGIGLQVLKACKLRDSGLGIKEISQKLEEITPFVRSQFAIETMEYLHKGGRCSGITRWVGTVLKLKPIIEVRDGEMKVGKIAHGKTKVALDKLLEYLEVDQSNLDYDFIFITQSMAEDSKKYLLEQINLKYPQFNNVFITSAGSVISSHCGKGTIGILYILKNEE